MKKISLILGFCLSAFAVYAQEDGLSLEFTAAMQWRNYEFKSFDQFVTNYNGYTGAQQTAPMPNLTYKQYPIGGIGFNVWGLAGMNVEYSYFSASTAIDFKNKERREIEFSGSNIRASFGIGFPLGRVIVKPHAYIEFTPTTMKSRYVYADGTVSYSPDRPLNGIFHANINNVGAGLRIIYCPFDEKLIGIMATVDYGSIIRSEPEVLNNLHFKGFINEVDLQKYKNGNIPRHFVTKDFADAKSYSADGPTDARLNQGLYPTISYGIGLYYCLRFNND